MYLGGFLRVKKEKVLPIPETRYFKQHRPPNVLTIGVPAIEEVQLTSRVLVTSNSFSNCSYKTLRRLHISLAHCEQMGASAKKIAALKKQIQQGKEGRAQRALSKKYQKLRRKYPEIVDQYLATNKIAPSVQEIQALVFKKFSQDLRAELNAERNSIKHWPYRTISYFSNSLWSLIGRVNDVLVESGWR